MRAQPACGQLPSSQLYAKRHVQRDANAALLHLLGYNQGARGTRRLTPSGMQQHLPQQTTAGPAARLCCSFYSRGTVACRPTSALSLTSSSPYAAASTAAARLPAGHQVPLV